MDCCTGNGLNWNLEELSFPRDFENHLTHLVGNQLYVWSSEIIACNRKLYIMKEIHEILPD